MATTISLGKVKFEFKGDYAGGTTYHVDDIVVFENRKFIYTNSAPSAGNAPLIEDTNWQYDYLTKKRHADLTKLKLNFTYWDYFEMNHHLVSIKECGQIILHITLVTQ